MIQFGFELEGFYRNPVSFQIEPPPSTYPTDGFPGLVEARTSGAGNLRHQLYMLMMEQDRLRDVAWSKPEYRFSAKQLATIHERTNHKFGYKICNIYGKSPRDRGRLTLASFQINMSQMNRHICKDGTLYQHGELFDYAQIIRKLDKQFAKEIKQSNRQPGMYAIKGCRVEYRSLPNYVVIDYHPNQLEEMILNCL